MTRRGLLLCGLLTLPLSTSTGRLPDSLLASPTNGTQNSCSDARFEGARFTHCRAIPGRDDIALKITGSDGILYRGFARLAHDHPGSTVAFAMNGGMYDAKSRPIGYYVEGGKKLYGLNLKDGAGNFHMKPNGVFFGTGSRWQVKSADDFAATVTARPAFGTQSGPMLVINGAIHPAIAPDGTSLYRRNAVGVDAKGTAHFVISEDKVSFGRMARYMRDVAATPNALYLDGEVSALWHPAKGRMDQRYPLGPLLVVTKTARKR